MSDRWLAAIPLAFGFACSGNDTLVSLGTGGTQAIGGAAISATTAGGTNSERTYTGGDTSVGGVVATGGAPAGNQATNATGGQVTQGGTAASSGAAFPTGGAKASGGAATGGGTGGTNAIGGAVTGGKATLGGGAPGGGATTGGGSASGGVTTGGKATLAGGSASGGMTTGLNTNATGGTAVSTTASSLPTSSGCGVDPPSDSGSIVVNGSTATYLLSLPKNYDKNTAYPILFAFHGAGVEPSMFVTYFNMPTVVGNDGIVVTPQCLGDAAAWSESRDLPLFDALLARMQTQYCIDDSRIFAGGHSSGGFFTHILGCRRGNVLRGIAALSAGPPSGTCVGDVAVWISQGNADPTVTPDTGRKARDFWVARNSCDATQTTSVSPSPTVEYEGCATGFPVRYCEYDGNHNLPSYAPKGIWDFFKAL